MAQFDMVQFDTFRVETDDSRGEFDSLSERFTGLINQITLVEVMAMRSGACEAHSGKAWHFARVKALETHQYDVRDAEGAPGSETYYRFERPEDAHRFVVACASQLTLD